jgi:hypothetical protein
VGLYALKESIYYYLREVTLSKDWYDHNQTIISLCDRYRSGENVDEEMIEFRSKMPSLGAVMHARSDFWYHIFFELGGSRLTESLSILDNPDLIMNKQVFTWLGKNDHEIAIRFLLLCEKLLDLPDIIEIRSFIDDFFLSNKGNCFDCLLQVF